MLCTLSISACTEFASGTDQLAPEALAARVRGRDAEAGGSVAQEGEPASTEAEAPSAADWSCLGQLPPAPQPLLAEPGTFDYSVRLVDAARQPVPEAVVRVCSVVDLACEAPVVENAAPDETGALHLSLAGGFDGYFEIVAPGMIPILHHIRAPLTEDRDDPVPISLLPASSLRPLAAASGLNLLDDLALLLASVIDCSGDRASGVVLSNDVGGLPFYFQQGLPGLAQATDSRGGGGFINVPPVLVRIRASVASTGQLVGEKAVVPRGGWATVVEIYPAARLE